MSVEAGVLGLSMTSLLLFSLGRVINASPQQHAQSVLPQLVQQVASVGIAAPCSRANVSGHLSDGVQGQLCQGTFLIEFQVCRAARFCNGAAHGGQVVGPSAIVPGLLQAWGCEKLPDSQSLGMEPQV